MSVAPAHSLILLDKPAGWTSHDVVGRMRRVAGTRRVGHAGTLDPMATGLLLIGIGQGTRLLTHLVGLSKTYTATIRLGASTTTDDAEGELLGEATCADSVTDAQIEEALARLRGPIQQVPSRVSAIKVDGQRAYARVRAGEDVQLDARPVTITRFEVLARRDRQDGPYTDLDVIVECSSGTYVRALARDVGADLGVGGHLTALRRTRVGRFSVEDAQQVPPRSADPDAPEPQLAALGLGAAAARALPSLSIDSSTARDLAHGKRPTVPAGVGADPVMARLRADADARAAALDAQGRLVAIVGARRGGALVPRLVIPADARS